MVPERRTELSVPNSRTLFGLYAQLRPGLTVKAWMEETGVGRSIPVDVRRMIVYAVARQWLRRLHYVPYIEVDARPRAEQTHPLLRGCLNGTKKFDDICVVRGISARAVRSALKREAIIWHEFLK